MNLLLADDHALFRSGLALMLEKTFSQSTLYSCSCWNNVHMEIEKTCFDMLLLDLFMPTSTTWEQELKSLVNNHPQLNICIISASSERIHIQTAYDIGVKAYLFKTFDFKQLQQALLQVASGKNYYPSQMWHIKQLKTVNNLTLRQNDILCLLSQGYSNKIIAHKLLLTESTVKRHIYNIFKILKVKNRIQALEVARKDGLLPHVY